MTEPNKNPKDLKNIPYLRAVQYLASFPGVDICPTHENHNIVLFAGRSNSGKSSLLSAICDQKNLAYVSSTAGKTRLLNYFEVPRGKGQPGLYLVDMPGFGYAKVSKKERANLRTMVDQFLLKAENIQLAVVVLDARRKLEEEESNILRYAQEVGLDIIFARTKWDKLNSKEKKEARALWKKEGISPYCIPVSNLKRIGLDKVLREIEEACK